MTGGIQGDRALPKDGVDRLGFKPMAARLAEALDKGSSREGLVVGVTGRWGSGKSSLLNLTSAALDELDKKKRPHLVEFKPWLVGDRNALLHTLFAELVTGIDQIQLEAGDATGTSLRAAKKAGVALRDFAAKLTGVGKVIKSAGFYIPKVAYVGLLIEKVGEAAEKSKLPSLAKVKDRVCTRLRDLERSLVVVIDDLDRLEPQEIVEVLRLVRSVADFPNITYVLSYDINIVSHAVEVAAKVEDGHAYLEKIVQITVPVPNPEAFDLRRWFSHELSQLGLTRTREENQRIIEIIDRDGGRYLTTPRTVVRTLDSIRFYWAALEGTVDFSDFVWLQFVKVGNPALYDWVSLYLTEMSARASGRVHISEDQIAKARKVLDAALAKESKDLPLVADRLAEFLPGIESYYRENDDRPGVYGDVDETVKARAVRDKRLASPDHYRLYFSFAAPANAPTSGDYAELLSRLAESPDAAANLIKGWQGEHLTSGVSKAEVVFDRLSSANNIELTEPESENLLMAMSNVMDELACGSTDDFGGPEVWNRAKRALPRLIEKLAGNRESVIRTMFKDGQAIGFLTAIFRDETFAHGRHGDRPSQRRLLSSAELDFVGEEMLARYRTMSLADFVSMHQPLSALFAWQQGGDEEGPRVFIAAEAETDEGLLHVLESLGSTSTVATGGIVTERVTLSRTNIQSLLDYEGARARIMAMASLPAEDPRSSRAKTLLQRFEDGDRF